MRKRRRGHNAFMIPAARRRTSTRNARIKFKLKKLKCRWLKSKNHIPTPPDFLAEVDFPQALPMDSADILREKSAIILQSFFKEMDRDQFT